MIKTSNIDEKKPSKQVGLNTEEKGIIVKIQRFSTQDGPGIRTTIFLKGCPLKCLWCSNPETINSSIDLEYNRVKCVPECSECISACGNGAIAAKEEYIAINRDKCIACGKCTQACYHRALALTAKEMYVGQVVDEAERDMPFYERSGGGVTLSGGEPLYQPEFAGHIAKECKRRNISTVLDTSGYVDWKILARVLKYTDLVLYDIKHLNPKEHKKYTGVSNKLILENAGRISRKGIHIILRIPVIPGINDTLENLRQTAEFAKSLPNLAGLHLLPYHRIGAYKYPMLDREYPLADLEQPTKEYMLKIRELLVSFGIKPLIVS